MMRNYGKTYSGGFFLEIFLYVMFALILLYIYFHNSNIAPSRVLSVR